MGSLTLWDYKQNEPGYNIEYDLAIASMVMHYNTNNVLDWRATFDVCERELVP